MKHHHTLFASLLGKTLLVGLATMLMFGSGWPNFATSASVQPPSSELRQPYQEKAPWLMPSQATGEASLISQPTYSSERLPRWVF